MVYDITYNMNAVVIVLLSRLCNIIVVNQLRLVTGVTTVKCSLVKRHIDKHNLSTSSRTTFKLLASPAACHCKFHTFTHEHLITQRKKICHHLNSTYAVCPQLT